MARKSYNFYRNELSLITLAVLIGFYAFTAFDICVNHYANSVLSHDEGTADMALWTRYMEDYNERYRELSQDIDEQRMQKLYGEDWEGLFARNANVTLNDQDISRIQALYNTEGDPDNDSVLQQLSSSLSENTMKRTTRFSSMSSMRRKTRSSPSITFTSATSTPFMDQKR